MTNDPPDSHRTLIQTDQRLLEPFLTSYEHGIYNPITDKWLLGSDPDHDRMLCWMEGQVSDEDLPSAWEKEGWVISFDPDWDRRSRLKFVSLEAHSICNQSCVFCPVSAARREEEQMPLSMFAEIVAQLGAYRDTLDGVFLNNYNEPTADPDFIQQVKLLKEQGLGVAINTNGSGLTPKRVDQLMELGGIDYLSVNLSTLDPDRYRRDRGSPLLNTVLKNLDYAGQVELSPRMGICVLGHRDDLHEEEVKSIRDRFNYSNFNVEPFTLMDRAQLLNNGQSVKNPHTRLRGCDQTGSRPLQHLHIIPSGKVVLCCQDYHHRYPVGDLTSHTVEEVLAGESLAFHRRVIYGYETIPDRHICSGCVFAKT